MNKPSQVFPTGLKETRSEVRLKTAVLTTDIHENRFEELPKESFFSTLLQTEIFKKCSD